MPAYTGSDESDDTHLHWTNADDISPLSSDTLFVLQQLEIATRPNKLGPLIGECLVDFPTICQFSSAVPVSTRVTLVIPATC